MMKTCMVPMATFNMILEHGGVHTKFIYLRCYLSLTTQSGLILKLYQSCFILWVSNANYLICIFMKFNENITMAEKSLKIHK